MSISIDSADPAEHDRVRGVEGTFERALRFIQNPLRKNRVAITCVLGEDLHQAQGVIDLAGALGCSLNFQPILFESNYPDISRLDWKKDAQQQLSASPQRERALRELHRYARKEGVVTNLGLVRRFFDTYCRYANTDEFFGDHLLKKFVCVIPFQQITIDERGLLCPCVLLESEYSIYEGDLYENWRRLALEHRRLWRSGRRFGVCRSCSCHFAENYRSSIIAYPLANRRSLPWLVAYYLGRLYHREGRKV